MIEKDRLISPALKDVEVEVGIRPLELSDYFGQDAIKKQVEVAVTASKQRSESLDHLLVFGHRPW